MFNKNFSELRAKQIFAVIFGILNTVGAVLSSVYVQKIIDAVINNNMLEVKNYAIQFLAILLLFVSVTFAFQYFLRYLVYTGSFQIRENLFKNLFSRKYREIISF